jgi:hypothetical protein
MTLIKRSLVPAGRAGNGTAESYGVNRVMWDYIWDYDNGYTAISMEYLRNIYGISMEYLWNIYGISVEYLRNIYGISME